MKTIDPHQAAAYLRLCHASRQSTPGHHLRPSSTASPHSRQYPVAFGPSGLRAHRAISRACSSSSVARSKMSAIQRLKVVAQVIHAVEPSIQKHLLARILRHVLLIPIFPEREILRDCRPYVAVRSGS